MSSKNKVKFGISNVYYAKMTVQNDGTITYATPVAIPRSRIIISRPRRRHFTILC